MGSTSEVEPKWSPNKLIFEASVSKFREIVPGVWYPAAAHATSYDGRLLQEGNEQKVRWEESYAIEKIELNPHYPASAFRELEIPAGATIYKVDSDGKIIETSTSGKSPEAPHR